jgi:glycosyltransferase involved in cell wall biosynthesis
MRRKILLKAPVLTRSGYGEQSRFALRSLRSREDLFDIYIQPLQWGQTSWINENTEERRWIDQVIEKTIAHIQQGGQFDISLQVTIPNEWEGMALTNIGYTAGIETTQVAHQWIEKGNEMDKIIVVSNHAKNTYENTEYAGQDNAGNKRHLRLGTPTHVVNYPAKTYENLPNLDLELENDFNFLTVAQFGPRKNLPNTVKWFVEEFHDEEVGLIIKSNIARNCIMDREKLHSDLKGFLSEFSDKKCKVYLLHGDMSDEEVHALYIHPQVKALVALPHGEGFGLPIFEAAYSGLPIIATAWSGQLDFLVDKKGKEQFYGVTYDLRAVQDNVVWENVLIKESMWAYPREQSAKEHMRSCYNDILSNSNDLGVDRATKLAAYIHDEFAVEKKYKEFCNAIVDEEAIGIENWLMALDEDAKEDEIVEHE